MRTSQYRHFDVVDEEKTVLKAVGKLIVWGFKS